MEIKVIASTHPGYTSTKQAFDRFGGRCAGVCYMAHDFQTLQTEPEEKTLKRADLTKNNGHHSVFDHAYLTLYLHAIPRVLEGMLDNERYLVSSVKSGRYTVHPLPADEQQLYDKWCQLLEPLIRERYQASCPHYFTDRKIKKLAMENARYLTSCFTQVSMVHTVSYRQLNYLYGFFQNYADSIATSDDAFSQKLRPYLTEFLAQLKATGYIDKILMQNGKNRRLSFFRERPVVEYFGDVYATNYRCSFATFLHLNRHRTLKYFLQPIPQPEALEFYVPEIIAAQPDLKAAWLADLERVRDHFPQAMLVAVSEQGNLDDFVLKVMERKCSAVMLETTRVVNDLLNRYQQALLQSKHPAATTLETMQHGARCTFPGYCCPQPCGFREGVNETRII